MSDFIFWHVILMSYYWHLCMLHVEIFFLMFQIAYNMRENVTRRVCNFHLAGGCNKKATCPFLHPSPPLGSDGSLIVCRYDKLPNGCRNVASCSFGHSLEHSTNKPRWQKKKLRKNKVPNPSQQSKASIPEKVVVPSPLLDLQLPDPSPVLKPAPVKRSSPSSTDERSTQKRSKPNNSLEERDSGNGGVVNDEQVKQLEHKVKLLAQDKVNLAQKVLKLELENAKLESQLEVVILPNSEDAGNTQTLKEELLKLEETRKILIDENYKTILSKDSEIRELKSSINKFKEMLETEDIEIKNNQSDIEAMEKEKGELVERLAADEREISRLTDNLREMENERDELDTENVDLKNKFNNIEQKIQLLERQKSQSDEKLKESNERLRNVLKEKDDLSSQLIGMEKERDDLDNENSVLQAELNHKNKEINLLKARLNLLESTTNINVS